MKSLRLCFVGPANNVTTRRWVEWFTKRGHETTVITVEPAVRGVEYCFRQVNVDMPHGPRKVRRLVSVAWLALMLKKLKPDVVHAHYLRGLAWGLMLSSVHPRVVTPWGSDVLEEQNAFPEWYGKMLTGAVLRGADLVTVHSEYMESRVLPLLKAGQRLVRIGWGVDLQQFRPGIDVRSLRVKWRIKESDRVIFSPRLMQPFYQHDRIVRALQLVCREMPHAVLILPEQFADEAYAQELRCLATELRIMDRVRFVGCIDYYDMPAWHNLAEAVVMMPRSDGMPNTLLETIACGGVPVLSKLPQYEELVVHGENGFLVEPEPDTIARTLVAILSDGEMRERMCQRNRALARERMDQDREMAHMECRYEELSLGR